MLQPKRIKYRKAHRGHRRGQANAGNAVSFGEFGLQAMGNSWMTARQIEAARRAITHHIRRGGKVWIRVFPDKPVTKKPLEVRMGSGKGAVEFWVAVIKPGRILYELDGVDEEVAREALRLASHKLAIQTRVVKREAGVL
jgi:large subunit ribosomal protein L16